jgi:hypothetical protein
MVVSFKIKCNLEKKSISNFIISNGTPFFSRNLSYFKLLMDLKVVVYGPL